MPHNKVIDLNFKVTYASTLFRRPMVKNPQNDNIPLDSEVHAVMPIPRQNCTEITSLISIFVTIKPLPILLLI